MNHTSNLIDVNIWHQFTLIEVYFLDLFVGMRLAFKGKFRSILAMIRDQSCLNMIATESAMQGDHKELMNLLQNCLIFSGFNRKLGLQRKNIGFYRKFYRENHRPFDSPKDDSTVEIARFKWARIPQSPHDFPPFFKGIKSGNA